MNLSSILIRQYKESDLSFIFSTWLRSYKFNSSFAKQINNTVFYTYHHKLIEAILARGATVLVACDALNPEVVFGYLVFEQAGDLDIVHFSYIKKPFRGFGIFTELLRIGQVSLDKATFTHYTTKCNKFLELNKALTYNPYLVWVATTNLNFTI